MSAPEIIFLQWDEEEEPPSWEETTWCSDKIHEYDVKYIRADSLSMAAPELLEACKQAEEWLKGWASAEPQLRIIRAAIAKAEPQS